MREPHRSTYQTAEWQAAKAEAHARSADTSEDGAPTCELEGCEETTGLEVHHLTPLSEGGDPYSLSNLVVLCPAHHREVERATRRRNRRRGA